MFKTHLAAGILAAIALTKYIPSKSSIAFLAAVIIGSVAPDIDCPKSRVGKKLKIISWMLNFLFKHRGFMHTIYPAAIIFLTFTFLDHKLIGTGFLIGYTVHLIADSLTQEGIQPFLPLSKKRVKGLIKTGGLAEYGLFLLILAFTINLLL